MRETEKEDELPGRELSVVVSLTITQMIKEGEVQESELVKSSMTKLEGQIDTLHEHP